ncbi:unnamed protein product [marine sediment metagenome]|uniref:Uncharacterized protein n=1 Tax=marine sediment metagenome TaxID=412755 RepID=X1QNJ2_9ZZZZ
MKEELKKLNLDKKSIDKIILNYSLEDVEEKLELLRIKRNVINPTGWLITALQVDYPNPESYREEKDEEETTEKEEMQPENKILKLEKIMPPKKEKMKRRDCPEKKN